MRNSIAAKFDFGAMIGILVSFKSRVSIVSPNDGGETELTFW